MNSRKFILFVLGLLLIALILKFGRRARTPDQLNVQGIRADVASAIETSYPDSKQIRLAAIQLARALQKSIDHPEDAIEMGTFMCSQRCPEFCDCLIHD